MSEMKEETMKEKERKKHRKKEGSEGTGKLTQMSQSLAMFNPPRVVNPLWLTPLRINLLGGGLVGWLVGTHQGRNTGVGWYMAGCRV